MVRRINCFDLMQVNLLIIDSLPTTKTPHIPSYFADWDSALLLCCLSTTPCVDFLEHGIRLIPHLCLNGIFLSSKFNLRLLVHHCGTLTRLLWLCLIKLGMGLRCWVCHLVRLIESWVRWLGVRAISLLFVFRVYLGYFKLTVSKVSLRVGVILIVLVMLYQLSLKALVEWVRALSCMQFIKSDLLLAAV